MNSALKSISGIKESAWTPIKYPDAIWDENKARLISYTQVAEFPSPTFTSITARLIVRRVQKFTPNTSTGKLICSRAACPPRAPPRVHVPYTSGRDGHGGECTLLGVGQDVDQDLLERLRPLEWCNFWPVILVTGVGHQDVRATA